MLHLFLLSILGLSGLTAAVSGSDDKGETPDGNAIIADNGETGIGSAGDDLIVTTSDDVLTNLVDSGDGDDTVRSGLHPSVPTPSPVKVAILSRQEASLENR